MMRFRALLLLLLALMLPAQGAMAAIMKCAPAGHVTGGEEQHVVGRSVHMAGHDHAEHERVTPGQLQEQDGSHISHNCAFCASICSLTPVLSSDIVLPHAIAARLHYPGIEAPVASFFSGGQERPPRTI